MCNRPASLKKEQKLSNKSKNLPAQILVLGMHRSGTSALTGALSGAGVFVGGEQELTGTNWENPKGFFERRDARNICDALLHGSGADWWKVSRFSPDNADHEVVRAKRSEIGELVSQLNERAENAWALKEPRLCVLLPIFRSFLSKPFATIVARHPVEVARSLRRRNGFPIAVGTALWEAYMCSAMQHAADLEHFVLRYDEILDKPERLFAELFEWLEQRGVSGLDATAAINSISPELRRERARDEDSKLLTRAQKALWKRLSDRQISESPPVLSPGAQTLLHEFESDQAVVERLRARTQEQNRELKRSSEKLDQLQSDLKDHREKKKKLEQRITKASRLEDELAQAKSHIETLKSELAQTHTRLEELEPLRDQLGKREQELAGAREQIDALQAASSKQEERVRELEPLREEAAKREAELARAESQIETLKSELAQTHTRLEELELLREETAKREAELAQAEGHIETLKSELAQTHTRLEELEPLRDQLGKREQELAGATEEQQKLEQENLKIAEVRDKLQSDAERYKALEREQSDKTREQEGLLKRQNERIELFETQLERLSRSRALRIANRLQFLPLNPLRWPRRLALRRRARRIIAAGLFDSDWYLRQYPDVRLGAASPVTHYLLHGVAECRWPHPVFDPHWYASQLEGKDFDSKTPVEHYLDAAPENRVSPHPLFDEQWYLGNNPDVAEDGGAPLSHFLLYGGAEGRSPHPRFDSARYLEQNPGLKNSGINKLVHYIVEGGHAGGNPSTWLSPTGCLELGAENPSAGINPSSHKTKANRERKQLREYDRSDDVIDSTGKRTPEAASTLSSKQRNALERINRIPGKKLPLTVLVISWDIGHNPVGRAYMLAEAVDRVVRDTVIAGFQFPRYGETLWEPLKNSRLPVISIPGKDFPDFIQTAEHIAHTVQPDVVIACKPRLPSLQLGLRIKEIAGCPLIVDIDDHELSFFKNSEPLGLETLEKMEPGALAYQREPYEEVWTRLAESLIQYADARFVSNTALQEKFEGILMPHVRDETRYFPANGANRVETRSRLGIPIEAKVVLFCGTLRLHKGIDELARAVGKIEDPDFRLVVVGTSTDRSVTGKLESLAGGRIIQLPNQPFDTIPEIVTCADVVALPQDINHPISLYQLPAKAIDAIAANVPLLVSRTPPLMDLVNENVAEVLEPANLAASLVQLANKGAPDATRDIFEMKYSYDAASRTLRDVFQRVIRGDLSAQVPTGFGERLQAAQARALGVELRADPVESEEGKDVVVFWKQNDTTLYGRRHDMVIKYLASRSDVRKVIVFDAPVSMHDLHSWRSNRNELVHHRLIYIRTLEKLLGLRDTKNICYRVFTYFPGMFRSTERSEREKPELDSAFVDYVRTSLKSEGVEPEQSVFWLYPKNTAIKALVDELKPARTVVDVVDDHRAWPGTTPDKQKQLSEHYRDILSRADFAICNCEPVRKAMGNFFPSMQLIPNGCDSDPEIVEPKGNQLYNGVIKFPGKVIGFVGNLESKIDIDLLDRIAGEFQEFLLVLVGSTHANVRVGELVRHSNVIMPGPVSYEEIGAWIRCFDVGIIPHIASELTESMNPLKLFVYAAHGVPVVATNVPNLADWDGLRVAAGNDAFVEALREILRGTDWPSKIAWSEFISVNSWRTRFESLLDEIIIDIKDDSASRNVS